MKKHTLVTGATGLIGRYLLRDLTLADQPLCVVVRPSKREAPEARIDEIMRMWEAQLGRTLPRPKVLAGEVTEKGMGLTADDRAWVARNCDRVLHNAAILDFYGPDRTGEPWATNLRGTENLLRFCRDAGLVDMHYVSTAYVCGNREGLIKETELDCGQTFRNDYEESKFLAEKAVREADFLEQLTIYRPAVVSGDSVNGYTSTYHGLYLYLKLISTVIRNIEPGPDGVRRVKARWNCTGDEVRNIVPVDWVSAVMTRIFNDPKAWGQTYHLAPTTPLTHRVLRDYLGRYFNSTGLEFTGRTEPPSPEQMSDLERDGYSVISIYQAYVTTDPRFDTTNVRHMAADLPCPEINEEMLHRYVQFGEEDRWGKRRRGALTVAAD